MQSLGLKTPIILDNGSGYCKCGFANQTIPSVEFPAYVGRPKYNQTMSREFKDAYVGMEAQSMRGVLRLNYPLEHGIVTHWDDMEKVRARVCGGGGVLDPCVTSRASRRRQGICCTCSNTVLGITI